MLSRLEIEGLQWGRDQLIAEIVATSRRSWSMSSFNGAAIN